MVTVVPLHVITIVSFVFHGDQLRPLVQPVRAAELNDGTADFTDCQRPPPSEKERGQLLRALAGDAVRDSLDRRFGVTLAFQNCHRVAGVPAGGTGW